MSLIRKVAQRTKRRSARVRSAVNLSRPRVTVHKSLVNVYAQIIDDVQQKTLASYSTLDLSKRTGDKKSQARAVGMELAKLARERGIENVWFDRGSAKYHGRVQALAEGLREGGLKF